MKTKPIRMKRQACILMLVLWTSSAGISAAADNSVVAKVGDNEVRTEDLRPYFEKLPLQDQLALSRDAAALSEYIRSLIIQQMVYKEALAKKWEQQPQVTEQIDRARRQVVTQTYLQSLATPPQDFPSSAELQEAYDKLKKNNALQVPRQYHLAQIYIACAKGADKSSEEKAQSKAEGLAKNARSGDFAAVAKSSSEEAASAANGGDLGWLAETQIQPGIRTAVAGLSKGGVSEPVRLNDGWHIVKLVETKDPYTASLEEIKGSLTNELRSQRAQLQAKAYLAKLLQQNPVSINEIEAAKLAKPKPNQ
jgi:parvulin-like peptidyl-prolyl isomerase